MTLFRTLRWVTSVGAILCSSTPLSAQSGCDDRTRVGPPASAVVVGSLARQLNDWLTRLATLETFSGQVLVARHDSVLLNGGYGFADRARCIRVSPVTAFDIGSLSKQFTGAAILRLAEDGRLGLHDSITRWLSNVPQDKRSVTISQLAAHTAGIPRYLDDIDADHFAADSAATRDSVVRAILRLPLRFAPGSRYEYSNMDYVLLAAIVERASGMRFEDYVDRNLFRRAGLVRTGFPSDARHWPVSQVAHAYSDLYDDGSPRERPDSWRALGQSGVLSTVTDLFRWHEALRSSVVLKTDPRQRLVSTTAGSYEFGWEVARRASDSTAAVIFHAGGTPRSFSSEFRYYPRQDLVVIVLCNLKHDAVLMQDDIVSNVSDFATRRDTALATVPAATQPMPTSPAVGRYVFANGDSLILWRDHTFALWLAPMGQRAFDLVYSIEPTDLRVRVATDRTHEFVDSLAKLPCGGIARPDSKLGTHEIRVSGWHRQWCAWRSIGAFSGLSVVGVAPASYSKSRAFVTSTLRFGAQVYTVQWDWDQSELVKSWASPDVPFPQSRALASLGDDELVLFDWFSGRTLQVSGLSSRAGTEWELRFDSNGVDAVAHRRSN